MQKSAKSRPGKRVLTKLLAIALLLAAIIYIAAMARNYWLQINLEKTKDKQQISSLEKKVDLLHQDMQATLANKPIDVQAYTTAQVKNAYLLVRTANVSLQTDRDLPVAKQLMQLAYEHLANFNSPKIEQVKAVLSADISRLNAVQVPDTKEIQAKLDILDKLIYILPPYASTSTEPVAEKPRSKAKTSTTQTWYSSVTNVVTDLKSIVKVRKKSEREVTITDLEIARAQFKLLIEQIRWAVLYNNNDVYQRSIKMAQTLLPEIFDINSESVQKFAATLQELAQIKMQTNIPNLQNSINALQAILVG